LALTDKLLLQLPRRLPPLSALRGLLLYLQQQEELLGSTGADAGSEAGIGSSSGGGAVASGGSLLADVAARVAQLWGDSSAVQRLAPPQQAYHTSALCGSLALLSRQQLDRQPQLLSALLAGITTRLDSPLHVRVD
jgi:telomere length regulation protein